MKSLSAQNSMLMVRCGLLIVTSSSSFVSFPLAGIVTSCLREERIISHQFNKSWVYLYWHKSSTRLQIQKNINLHPISTCFLMCEKDTTCKNKYQYYSEFHILVCRELLKFLGKAICWDVMSCLQICLRSIEWSATSRSNYGPECHTGYGIIMQWNQ